MEPTFRCGTRKAIDSLALELNLPNDLSMQDWSYQVANHSDINKYLSHYSSLKDDDMKFVLMEIIIEATENQNNEKKFSKYCETVKIILEKDFKLHEYTIYYWACFDNENLEDCWQITPLMRQIWKNKN
jgi:predicted SAM-dependent methyltransferase